MKQHQSQYRRDIKICKSAVIACGLLSASAVGLTASLPERADIGSTLASAERVVLYSLEPGKAAVRDPSGACVGLCYYGWPVLGQMEVSLRSGLTKQVASWLKNPEPDEKALCFDPRHGVRVIAKEKTIDFVICFECDGVAVYVNSKEVKLSPHPSNVQRDWDRLLRKAGVKLADEPYAD
jgi:hypothetical protein